MNRCNFILDKLEEKNSEDQGNSVCVAGDGAGAGVGSVHSITIVGCVVYGSIYLPSHNVTLYVKPMNVSEISYGVSSCHCAAPSSSCSMVTSCVTSLENIITTTQQRLLDDGILEQPSCVYTISSFDMVAARISVQRQAEALSRLSLFFPHAEGGGRPSFTFLHPHEAIVASMMHESSAAGDRLRLLLSEEGSHVHVTLASLGQASASASASSEEVNAKASSRILFQDKFLAKQFGVPARKASAGRRREEEGVFFIPAAQFVDRLEREVTRIVDMTARGRKGGAGRGWGDIGSVHFLHCARSHASNKIATEKNDLQMWLHTALCSSVVGAAGGAGEGAPGPSMHRRSLVALSHRISPRPLSQLPVGCAVGLRVHNCVATVTEDASGSDGAGGHATMLDESSDFISFLEPSEGLPAQVRRRVRGTTRRGARRNTVALVLDVVEASHCCSDECRGRGDLGSCAKGLVVHSLLSGALEVAIFASEEASASASSSSTIAAVDLFVEICVDVDRNVTLRVVDVLTEREELAISSHGGPLLSSPGAALKSLRKLHCRKERCVTDLDAATSWSCAELAANFKERGNSYMTSGDYIGAVQMYSSGLSCVEPGEAAGVLASNRYC